MFVRQERRELENRLSLIESKQRQLEAQDRLISEALTFSSQSVGEPVADGVKDSSMSDEALHRVLDMRYSDMSEHHGGTYLSTAITGVTSSKPVCPLPSSSYSGIDATETVHSAVPLRSRAGVESGLDFVPHSDKTLSDGEVDSHANRVREYQDELLRRQTDRQHAVLEARRRLQMRAEQLLNSGLNLVSESQRNTPRAGSQNGPSLTVPCDELDLHEVENHDASRLSGTDLPQVRSSDVLHTQVVVTKPYKPELYQPKSLSENTESFEHSAAVAGPDDGHDTDDDRQFVTPELREDGRVRPCRVAEYSPSPSPHADNAAYQSEQLQLSTLSSHSNMRANKDDFSSLILQAQRDLEVRQQQMQDQLEALENEEQRLAEQQLRISSQLGSFPSNIQTFAGTTYSQPQTAVTDPCLSSSSDLPADVVTPSMSARNTASISQDCHDMSGLRSDQKDQMTMDNTSPQAECHQIHLSYSAPLLQNKDGGSVYGTSDQMLCSRQSPVSIIFCRCSRDILYLSLLPVKYSSW